jgi:proline iminopeptidase
MQRLIDELPEDYKRIIRNYDQLKDYKNPDYINVVNYFYRKHLLRLDEMPDPVKKTFEFLEKRKTYEIMNGPNEFTITGTIKDFDIADKLHKTEVLTLITVGRYDEVTIYVAELIHKNIKKSKLVVFENSSHMAIWEEREKYISTIKEFIEGVYST